MNEAEQGRTGENTPMYRHVTQARPGHPFVVKFNTGRMTYR